MNNVILVINVRTCILVRDNNDYFQRLVDLNSTKTERDVRYIGELFFNGKEIYSSLRDYKTEKEAYNDALNYVFNNREKIIV